MSAAKSSNPSGAAPAPGYSTGQTAPGSQHGGESPRDASPEAQPPPASVTPSGANPADLPPSTAGDVTFQSLPSRPVRRRPRPAGISEPQVQSAKRNFDRLNSERLSHDLRILLLTFASGLPAAVLAMALLWYGSFSARTQWTLTILIAVLWLGFAFAVRERVVFPLQTLSNLLAALREGDYSIRGRGASKWSNDPLGDVMVEINALGETLREQRLGALEATALLRKVMAEIEVAVFTFDSSQRLRLVNRAGERLLARPSERILGRTASDLGLADCLEGEPVRTLQVNFPGGQGRWELRRSSFREHGLPHQLIVLSDLSRALREEERQAWQRLVRVLGHELNNSLTPIKSIAESLEYLMAQEPQPADWREDMRHGLSVITSRAQSLARFMGAYAQLARLPAPKLQPVDVRGWMERVASLETRVPITLVPGADLTIQGDPDQLEQLLINLLRNAADASLETGGGVQAGWLKAGGNLEVWVRDEGPGLSNTANLFVPFFTTKPGGSGIGLALSRQIAEAHGGTLTLENRTPGPGCEARLKLPLSL